MNIVIGVPCPKEVPIKFVESLIGIISYTKEHLKGVELGFIHAGGVRTDKNRNVILKQALEVNADYILWLDADMIFPHDIIVKFMEHPVDIVGSLYFKRSEPHDPIGYIKGNNPLKPFKCLNPDTIPQDALLEIDGLGFGGTMVNINVYKTMGDDKWMNYDSGFHLPFENEHSLTHDLVFCRKAQEYGYKIYIHTGVTPGHLAEKVITVDDWRGIHEAQKEVQKTVTIIMPTIHPKIAKKTAKILSSRAGYPHKMFVVEDERKEGFVAICNAVVRNNPSDYYVYLTDDIFPSRNWLLKSMESIGENKLLGYNDGKWQGAIATCGLVESNWMKNNYNGDMFLPGYFGHYNDTELTMFAMNDRVYAYNPNICLTEVDYEKETKKVHAKDRALFKERKKTMFDGRINDIKLVGNFA